MGTILLGVFFAIAALTAISFFLFHKKAETDATIRIPANASSKMVSDTLTKYFGDSFSSSTLRFAKLMNVDFTKRHGAYHITAGTSAFRTARRLGFGAQSPVKITINGFRNKDLMLDKISAKMDFPSDSLRKWLDNSEYMASYGLNPENAMALFLDDTYEMFWSSSAKNVLDKIGKNYLDFWDDQNKAKAREMNLTPAQVTIIASITDEETNNNSEKGTIGRLYNNRLQKGMRLQSDPTVRFALNDFTIKRVKGEHLNVNSPYNTYRNPGLPPGPIRTTGKNTLNAILSSEPNPYLYMCAKEDFSGTHNFASTFSEHSKNAARYRKALNERGIR